MTESQGKGEAVQFVNDMALQLQTKCEEFTNDCNFGQVTDRQSKTINTSKGKLDAVNRRAIVHCPTKKLQKDKQ
jgi:hypothetical protein